MSKIKLISILIIVVVLLLIGQEAVVWSRPLAAITYFEPEKKIFIPGEEITSLLKIKNTGKRKWTFWIKYQIDNQKNNLHYSSIHSIEIEPGEESPLIKEKIKLPELNMFEELLFDAKVSIYKEDPNQISAKKITDSAASVKISVPLYDEQFNNFNEEYWYKNDYTFLSNRGYFFPKNIYIENSILRLHSPANNYEGAGIESKSAYGYGSYSASIKCPRATGMLCAFFLYQPNIEALDYSRTTQRPDELDIEIFADGSRRVEIVLYSGGQKNHFTPVTLPFDPANSFHEYQIDYYQNEVRFLADKKVLAIYNNLLPSSPLKVMSNFWWPWWMPSAPKNHPDYYMEVDWIKYTPKTVNF